MPPGLTHERLPSSSSTFSSSTGTSPTSLISPASSMSSREISTASLKASDRYSDLSQSAQQTTPTYKSTYGENPLVKKSNSGLQSLQSPSASNFHHSINNSKRFSMRHGSTSSSDNNVSPTMKSPSSYSSLISNPTPPSAKQQPTLLSSINRQQPTTTSTAQKRSSVKDNGKPHKDSKRLSIFPWSNRKPSSSGASHNNYYTTSERIPIISDPVLKSSSMNFISSDPLVQIRPAPVITTFAQSPHSNTNRNSSSSTSGSRRTSSATSPPGSTPRTQIAPLIEENPEESITPHGTASIDSLSKHERTASTHTVDACLQTDDIPVSEASPELRRKLRESEQKTLNVLIEYQQKLDKSRKRVLELERKLQEEQRTNREIVSSGTIVMVPSTPVTENYTLTGVPGGLSSPSPSTPVENTPNKQITLTPTQMQVRINSLESQRDSLRDALKGLRHNKDMESRKFQEQISRMNRMSNLQNSLAWDPFFISSARTGKDGNRSLTMTPNRQLSGYNGSQSGHHSSFSVPFATTTETVAKATKQRNPSLDLTIVGDSTFTSPMSASSTGTVHSVSSSSSTESTWTTSSTGTYQKPTPNNQPISLQHHHQYHQHHTSTLNGQQESMSLLRRIGVGPFLPLGPPVDIGRQQLQGQQQRHP